tara:strand:+ start:1233 stop:1781 length:549 start_codon:yes stop_codon:yes gene_type:complete
MDRMEKTCSRLHYLFDRGAVLMALGESVDDTPVRLRVTINLDGIVNVKVASITEVSRWSIGISDKFLQSNDPWLGVKTTNRALYDTVRSQLIDFDEVLFLNEKREVCEGTITNIFVRKNNILVTPPISCGCLPGVLREEMLLSGQAQEGILFLEDLRDAAEVFVGNSLRGLIAADLVDNKLI